MKTKSISCCVLGVVFSIIGAFCAYVFDVLLIFLIFAIKQNPYIILLPYINIGMYVVSLAGAIICLFNKKVSGIIMLISSIINVLLLVVLCIWLKQFHILFVLFWLPTLFILIIAFTALIKSKQQKKS